MGGGGGPRQKMINMMYLVLTALLAMNVSAEILDAFRTLKSSIRSSADSFNEKNRDTAKMIRDKVAEEMGQGNKKNEIVLTLLEAVQAKTIGVQSNLESIIERLDVIAGKDTVTGLYSGMKNMEGNYQLWMGSKDMDNGGRGNGEAMALKDQMDSLIIWANDFYNKESAPVTDSTGEKTTADRTYFKPFMVNPVDDPGVPESSDHKNKPWEIYTFGGKPVIADLALVEKFKLDVANVEYDLLQLLKAKLGAVTFKIDSLILVSAPTSQVVVAGMPFETKLFVTMASKDIIPTFGGSGAITKENGGMSGIMKVNTSSSGFAPDQYEKEQAYSVSAKVPKADGSTANLTMSGKFKVRKPEVVVTSASVQNLYHSCGNMLNVDVPALGELYDPVFSATSAKAIPSTKSKKKVTIVPTGSTCILTVSSKTNGGVLEVGKVKYTVIKPPQPRITIFIGKKEYNGASPIPKKANCTVKVVPNSDFRKALPKDARYAIKSIKLKAQRSLGAPVTVKTFKGGDAVKGIKCNLGSSLKSDSPGTKIYFVVDRVNRINFQNSKVKEKFGEIDLTIGAVIK